MAALRSAFSLGVRMASSSSGSFYTRALMCPPDHFSVQYKINSWMGGVVEPAKARAQWDGLKAALEEFGVTVDVIPQVEGLPDMVFVCNSGLAYKNEIYLAAFRHPQRQGERAHYEEWFNKAGFKLNGDGSKFFEGGGDAVFSDPSTLWAGFGQRSEPGAYDEIARMCPEVTIHRIPLVHPDFYHFDTCFFPVGDKMAVVYPAAFDESSLELMRSKLALIEVSKAEAEKFACNGLSVGPKQVVLPAGCDETAGRLRAKGVKVLMCDMSEFMKSGGACQCLVMKLW